MTKIYNTTPRIALRAALAAFGIAAFGMATPAWADQSSANDTAMSQQGQFRLVDAGTLIDADVNSNDGQTLGKLKYLMIDPRDADIVLAMVGSTQRPGDFIAVPWDKVDLARWQGGAPLALKVAKANFDKASHYTITNIGKLTTPMERTKVYDFYGSSANDTAKSDAAQPYMFYGHDFVATLADPALTLDNKLKGSEIFSTGDNPQKLGEIKNLVIDPARGGKVAFAVVGTSSYLGMGERDTRIPLQALEWTGKDQYLLSQTEIDSLKKEGNDNKTPSSFDKMSRDDMAELYRGFGVTPYWKG